MKALITLLGACATLAGCATSPSAPYHAGVPLVVYDGPSEIAPYPYTGAPAVILGGPGYGSYGYGRGYGSPSYPSYPSYPGTYAPVAPVVVLPPVLVLPAVVVHPHPGRDRGRPSEGRPHAPRPEVRTPRTGGGSGWRGAPAQPRPEARPARPSGPPAAGGGETLPPRAAGGSGWVPGQPPDK